MTHDEILVALFPSAHSVQARDGLLLGTGALGGTEPVSVIGIVDGSTLGVEGALTLAGHLLDLLREEAKLPILVLVDSGSQRMSRYDELLGLNEYLAHLAKVLLLAKARGHRTIGILYGASAAGAFIATALSCDTLLALPGAHPMVMDLPSMARITKLPVERLLEMAGVTPVFAPGLENFAQTGAIQATLDIAGDLAAQVLTVLRQPATADGRDLLGAERGGRSRAASLAARVQALALG